MSLILDALRKADSERERGSVPGLYAQPVPTLSVEMPSRRQAAPWISIAIAVALVLVAWLVWRFGMRPASQAVAERSAALSSTAPTVAEPVRVPAPDSAAPVAPATPPAPIVAQSVAEPAPWPAPESRSTSEKAPPAAARPEAKAPLSAAPAEPPIQTREQLPDRIRAELPQLAISGSIYSSVAADRSLIINGRIFRENDRLTADLLLEQIRLKSAVLRYKGHRFEVGY